MSIKSPWRQDFPQLKDKDMVYLDSAASSLKPQIVIDSICHYYQKLSVNIHRGIYDEAYEATEAYETTRLSVAKFLNADEEEIVFTRGATASFNFLANSLGPLVLKPGDEIIVNELEHHSSILPWQVMAKKMGATLVYLPLDESGRITVQAFQSVLSDKTKIVAMTYISNVMGYQTPLEAIIPLAHEKKAYVIVDAAQAAPHIPIDVKALDADFLAFSGHKMLGPTGVGILYGKKSLLALLEPTEFGGEMNENVDKFSSEWKDGPYKFEAGTMPIASVIGLKSAIDYLLSANQMAIHDYVLNLRDKAYQQLKTIEGITIYNPTSTSSLIAFNIDRVHPHDAASYFAEHHIALRAGHHCAQLIIKWLGIEACLRASFYLYNDEADVNRFVQTVRDAVEFFRSVGF